MPTLSDFMRPWSGVPGLLFAALLSAGIMAPARATDQSAASCVSADEAQNIRHLLELIDLRLQIASDVARAKWNSGAPVNDPAREAQLLDAISAQARLLGATDLTFVRDFFQAQFDAGKLIQADLLLQWHTAHPDDFKFDDAPDLARDIRPRLDLLNPELIRTLLQVKPNLPVQARCHYLSGMSTTIIRNDIHGDVRRMALKTLQVE